MRDQTVADRREHAFGIYRKSERSNEIQAMGWQKKLRRLSDKAGYALDDGIFDVEVL